MSQYRFLFILGALITLVPQQSYAFDYSINGILTAYNHVAASALKSGAISHNVSMNLFGCTKEETEIRCTLAVDRYTELSATGFSESELYSLELRGVPLAYLGENPASYAAMVVVLATFTERFSDDIEGAKDFLGEAIRVASKEDWYQVTIGSREVNLTLDGVLTIFESEGNDCDGCDETDSSSAPMSETAEIEVAPPVEGDPQSSPSSQKKTGDVGPNFTTVLQSKVLIDICTRGNAPPQDATTVAKLYADFIAAAKAKGLDAESMTLTGDNVDVFKLIVPVIPLMLLDPSERQKAIDTCAGMVQSLKLAVPYALGEIARL